MQRDLSGRCGTCAFFIRLYRDEQDVASGECRLGWGVSPLADSATCASHKALGTPWTSPKPRRAVVRGERSESRRRQPTQIKELDLSMDGNEFREILRDVLREELGLDDVDLADRWRGGKVVLKPGKEGVQEKQIPIEALFHKIVMIRDKLRVLEQKINGNAKLADDEKVQLQQYITGCYGSLTTFNVLFNHRENGFLGQNQD